VLSLILNFVAIPKFGMMGAAVVNVLVEFVILALTIRVTILNHRQFQAASPLSAAEVSE
jgi:O-antigen/teichoic acid export membrane protein